MRGGRDMRIPCDWCAGLGFEYGEGECPKCEGRGWIRAADEENDWLEEPYDEPMDLDDRWKREG